MTDGVTRRKLLVVVPTGAASLALGGCALMRGGASHEVLGPDQQTLEGNQLRVPLAALAGIGTRAVEVKPGAPHPDLLISSAGEKGWHVITAHCTHKGCVVDWSASANEWQCPCHGSRFAVDGQVLHGPAERPLTAPSARVDGDALVVDLQSVPASAAASVAAPPSGGGGG